MSENQPTENLASDVSPEVIRVTTKILKIEKEYLFESKSQGIVDDLVNVFKEEIK